MLVDYLYPTKKFPLNVPRGCQIWHLNGGHKIYKTNIGVNRNPHVTVITSKDNVLAKYLILTLNLKIKILALTCSLRSRRHESVKHGNVSDLTDNCVSMQ